MSIMGEYGRISFHVFYRLRRGDACSTQERFCTTFWPADESEASERVLGSIRRQHAGWDVELISMDRMRGA